MVLLGQSASILSRYGQVPRETATDGDGCLIDDLFSNLCGIMQKDLDESRKEGMELVQLRAEVCSYVRRSLPVCPGVRGHSLGRA